VRCDYTWFSGRAWFDNAEIRTVASFHHAHFSHLARFDGVECAEDISFVGTHFAGEVWMDPVVARGLNLRDASFDRKVEISGSSEMHVDCMRTRFEGGVNISSVAVVHAHMTYFGGPSMLFEVKVMSLVGSDVSNLVLSEADLSECEFLGAHRLEQLRIDGPTRFAMPEKRWRARRRMLVEEGAYDPLQVAALYRALRKSFEDSKNEAGAGDFYYGEMECRRHSKESSIAERVILWFYWLLSGYGQRASRALIALVVVVAVVTSLLTVWGQDFGMAARIAVGAVVFRDDRTELTATGEWTVLIARFLGPVLLALAVLAVRARVKR
jgi:hypothetical protein